MCSNGPRASIVSAQFTLCRTELQQQPHSIRPCATLQEAARQQWEEEKAQMLQDTERWSREQVAEIQSQAQEELLAVQAEAASMWVPTAGL